MANNSEKDEKEVIQSLDVQTGPLSDKQTSIRFLLNSLVKRYYPRLYDKFFTVYFKYSLQTFANSRCVDNVQTKLLNVGNQWKERAGHIMREGLTNKRGHLLVASWHPKSYKTLGQLAALHTSR